MIPTWEALNRLGKSRVLQTSYVWLLVVPTAARVVSAIDSPIALTGIGEGLRFNLELPFSWKLFYFTAIAISIAGIIYTVVCPPLIRNFSTFQDFESEGRGLDYLKSYATRHKIIEFTGNAHRAIHDPNIMNDAAKEWRGDVFWQIYEVENVKHPMWRFACVAFYAIGLTMSAVVLVQNFIYVVEVVVATGF